MKPVNTWKICATPRAGSFLLINARGSDVLHGEGSSKTQDRQAAGFEVTEHGRFMKMCSDCSNTPLVKLWCIIKEGYAQVSAQGHSNTPPFPYAYMCETRISSRPLTK